MSLSPTIDRRLRRLEVAWTPPPAVPTLPPMSALELWQAAMGCEADAWQRRVLRVMTRALS